MKKLKNTKERMKFFFHRNLSEGKKRKEGSIDKIIAEIFLMKSKKSLTTIEKTTTKS